jgi:hypothetical protein
MKELQMLTDLITPREIQTSQSLSRRMRIALSFTLACLSSHAVYAQSPAVTDLLRWEFIAKDFSVNPFGPVRWMNGGQSYVTLEPADKADGARDIVRYDTATAQREVLVSALQLVPLAAINRWRSKTMRGRRT